MTSAMVISGVITGHPSFFVDDAPIIPQKRASGKDRNAGTDFNLYVDGTPMLMLYLDHQRR